MAAERPTCPCKRAPLYLSSFSAAELGDLHSLHRKNLDKIASQTDSAGNTPLHLAAQHGHMHIVEYLLPKADVNAGKATPLHRASYSGAVGTVRQLLEVPTIDLLRKDTSFGDEATALHKAVSGGRYLVVELLLEQLQRTGQLEEALSMRDASGRAPLQVAQLTPKPNVTRWNFVAGGLPDWDKCEKLLQRALASQNNKPSSNRKTTQSLPALPASSGYCVGDCDDTTCRTAVWEAAFRKALGNSVDSRLGSLPEASSAPPSVPEFVIDSEDNSSHLSATPLSVPNDGAKNNQSPTTAELGRPCTRCSKHSFVLYDRAGDLVCKACFKAR